MRKCVVLLAMATVAVAAVPDVGQAFWRRNCRPAPCYCPVVVMPCGVPAGYYFPSMAPTGPAGFGLGLGQQREPIGRDHAGADVAAAGG